jgi:hypothetical protein
MNRNLPYIPIELQRIILEFRGSEPFVIFKTEIGIQKRKTNKWYQDFLGRTIEASLKDDDDSTAISDREWRILLKMVDKKFGK